MPCVPVPKPPLPSIPKGLSLSAPLPSPPQLTVKAPCCILPALTTPPIPAILPPLAVNPGLVTTIREALKAIEDYFDQIPLDCPRS